MSGWDCSCIIADNMAEINFICKKCGKEFDCNVGEVTFPSYMPGARPVFEKGIQCNSCGILTMDEVELTEWGQTQLSELFFSNMRKKR